MEELLSKLSEDFIPSTYESRVGLAPVHTSLPPEKLSSPPSTSHLPLDDTQETAGFDLFARSIAHDLNNLLLAIMGFSDLALNDVPDGTLAHANIEQALKASRNAKSLVQQLLTFGRSTHQELHLVALDHVVQEALPVLHSSLPVHLQLSVSDLAPGMILGDPMQIQQVLMNLLVNAAHAMGDRSDMIQIGLQYIGEEEETSADPGLGSSLCLLVRDTGCGMSAALRQHIFSPGFTTKPIGTGNGLGLAIVDHIVKAHGATLTVDSQPGKGTTFRIYFPVIEKAGKETETVSL